MFLEGLHALLKDEDDLQIVGLALNGEEAMTLLRQTPVDVVVTDLEMPGMDGLALNSAVKKQYPTIKTLILSSYSEPDKISKLAQQKANGYLLKNAEKAELLAAIHTLHSGRNYFSEAVQKKYTDSIFSEAPAAAVTENILSKREREILKYIAAEHTTAEIAEKLFISQNTVNTHRKNLIAKLGVKNIAGLVKYAFQHGLV